MVKLGYFCPCQVVQCEVRCVKVESMEVKSYHNLMTMKHSQHHTCGQPYIQDSLIHSHIQVEHQIIQTSKFNCQSQIGHAILSVFLKLLLYSYTYQQEIGYLHVWTFSFQMVPLHLILSSPGCLNIVDTSAHCP